MKARKTVVTVALLALLSVFTLTASAIAEDSEINVPISAEQAYDAVLGQVDPITQEEARVVLVDVRTAAEYYWVGAPGMVERIETTYGEEFVPYNGKVISKFRRLLFFEVQEGDLAYPMILPIRFVEKIHTTDISIHVPTHTWVEEEVTKVENPQFAEKINALSAEYDVLILMCRSGKRSNTRNFDATLFDAVYEVDQPDGTNGRGGFQGTSYGDVYNGYRGYPGRATRMQEAPSVSWSDTGLPVHIGWKPFYPEIAPE